METGERRTTLKSVRLIKPKRIGDERGWFCETYNRQAYLAMGVEDTFVQDNHSMSAQRGTLRGLHYQIPPHDQAKLVSCLRGRIWDVVVDIRVGSPTFGHHIGVELASSNGWQLYVPTGFAHGFVTLEPDTEVAYKVTTHYAPSSDAGIAWNDPGLAIKWPIGHDQPAVGQRDMKWPRLADITSPFRYDGAPLVPLSE
ncbi:MAG: dTDP-4-dehydrorhamnose 3,5-epimerase [Caldisericota bacterium]|nr:dTDP-4-dehydrorhamnose 3,5-epimerase [Caldisericota bacterium]